MKKRMVSWIVCFAMLAGALTPSVPSYAQAETETESEILTEEGTEAVSLESAEESSDEAVEATTVIEEETEAEPSDAAGYVEEEIARKDIAAEEITDDAADVIDVSGRSLELRAVNILYGEIKDNEDGALDELFGLDLEGYTTNYKFVILPDEADEEEITAPADEESFAKIEAAELETIPAGSRVAVYVMATPEAEGLPVLFGAQVVNVVEGDVPETDSAAAASSEEDPEKELVEEETAIPEEDEEGKLLGDSGYKFGFLIYDDEEYLSFSADESVVEVELTVYKKSGETKTEVYSSSTSDFDKSYNPSATLAQLGEYYAKNKIKLDVNDYEPGEYVAEMEFFIGPSSSTESLSFSVASMTPQEFGFEVTPATGKNNSDGKLTFASNDYSSALVWKEGGGNILVGSYDKMECNNLKPGTYFVKLFDLDFPNTIGGDHYLSQTYRCVSPVSVVVDYRIPVDHLNVINMNTRYNILEGYRFYLPVGQAMRIMFYVSPDNAYDTKCEVSSSDPSVVSVDQQGNIKTNKEGSARITVKSHGLDKTGAQQSFTFEIIVSNDYKLKKVKSLKFKSLPARVELTPDMDPESKKDYIDEPVELEVAVDKDYNRYIYWDAAGVYGTGTAYMEEGFSQAENGVAKGKLKPVEPSVVDVYASTGGTGYEATLIKGTISLDGVEVDDKTPQRYLKDGIPINGLVGLDENYHLAAIGNSVLTSKKVAYAYYADANEYGRFVQSTYAAVGKKLYYFGNDGCLVKGTSDTDTTTVSNRCINKKGELLTGWVKIGEKEYYYSPADGRKVGKNNWVPRGKGMTYIENDDGSFGIEGPNTIDGSGYFFANGLFITGLLYFGEEDKLVKANSKDAIRAYYFDPVTGIQQTAASGKTYITIKGKDYYWAKSTTGMIPLNIMYLGEDNKYHISDKTGAVIKNKFITLDNNTYYADQNGCLLQNCVRVIGGKSYTFEANCVVRNYTDYLETAMYVDNEGTPARVYTKLSKANKPSDGTTFYYKTSDSPATYALAKSMFLYTDTDFDDILYHTDDKGKLAVGPVRDGFYTYWFDPDTAGFGANGSKHIVSFKNKMYLCLEDGTIKRGDQMPSNDKGFSTLVPETDSTPTKLVYISDKSGALGTGMVTYSGHKFIIGADGIMSLIEKDHVVNYKGKYYLVHGSSIAEGCYIWTDDKKEGIVTTSSGDKYSINKDGSAKKGWTTKNKKKYYARIDGKLAPGGELCMIGGKQYLFNDETDPYALSGWNYVKAENGSYNSFVYANNLDNECINYYYDEGPYYFYFDPKTCAAVTGFKKIPAPELLSDSSLAKDENGLPKIGSGTKDVYFNADAQLMPLGALASNMDITVKGKLYRFGANGVAISGKPGFTRVYDETLPDAYLNSNGTLAIGRTAVKKDDGSTAYYYFDENGVMSKNVLRKTGNKWYFYGMDGEMSCNLTDYHSGSGYESILAVFNKDGSIKQFVDYKEGKAIVLKNTVIYDGYSNTRYYLGKNGLPLVGYNKVSLPGDGAGAVLYNNDGSFYNDGKNRVMKNGSKYYLVLNGEILTDTTRAYEIQDYSSLPEADREAFESYKKMLLMFGSDELYALVNSDGSLSAGNAVFEGMTYHKNKYGVVVDTYSAFAKSGSNWYMSYGNFSYFGVSKGVAGTVEIQSKNVAAYLASDGVYAVTVRITYDQNGKVISAVNAKTGELLNGAYALDLSIPHRFYEEIINFKKGLPAGGTQTYEYRGSILKVPFDTYGACSPLGL